ncbi:hypothetical protein [Paenibacillus sp. J2TS4]|uniref:hypothetical protein n=1 Tax=Paenibacillus sp. J2TS4 TaxID=2807194 RepID=UPI001B1F7402|nr:hypothetical protein [Paenibacillus sp. J2TS4]GIP32007.1 hypothetical protein J2TS4_12170 [Paenibacillus sp. J2TS4]
MRERLTAFASAYAAEADSMWAGGDELRSLSHPLVFLFVGDRSAETLDQVYELNRRKWNNSAGIVYLHVGTQELAAKDNVYNWRLDGGSEDRRTLRSGLYRRFYDDDSKLLELNVTLRQMNSRISEFGRLYSSLQRLHIAVVTRLDDPCNVLVPELTVLMKSIFGESFRSVVVDMYGLLQEKQVDDEFAYTAALGISFLRELDEVQRREFRLAAELQVTGDGIKLPVEHRDGPLFDTAHLIGDKDERGLFTGDGMRCCSEIICHLNLLKNRKISGDLDPRHGVYNHQQFKQNIMPPGEAEGIYASAGFAKVTRPNQAIALTVLYHIFRRMLRRMQDNAGMKLGELLERIDLDPARTEADVRTFTCGHSHPLEAMHGLLYENAAYHELRKMTLRQAETALYSDNARAFFDANAVRQAEAALAAHNGAGRLEQAVRSKLIDSAAYGCYCTYVWTSEPAQRTGKETPSLKETVRGWRKEAERQLEDGKLDLEALYEERVDDQGYAKGSLFGLLSSKSRIKPLARGLLARIYGLKLELLELELRIKLYREYERKLEEVHDQVKQDVERLREIESVLHEASRRSISEMEDELGRNIHEYYGQVVDRIADEAEARYGPQFYFDERYIGNVTRLLAEGDGQLIDRLIETARKEWFVHPLFHQPFEQELLERANVTVSYDNREALTKEQLYRDLYVTLESEAAIRLDVYGYTHKHRYEEKYLFGDFHSEWIQYAYSIDQGSRTYKLGCVHEKKQSGVEKLNLMGGFRIADLMYYRNGWRYYDTYVRNGYLFHGRGLADSAIGPMQEQESGEDG